MDEPWIDHERFICKECKAVILDIKTAPTLPIMLGDAGLLVHVGVCFMCGHAATGQALEDIYRAIWDEEAWDKTERRIDAQIRLSFPSKKRGK